MLPEIGYGVIPDTGGVARLFQICGHGVAADLVLTGRVMDAAEALAHGVVSRLVPADKLDETAREIADRIAALPAVSVKIAAARPRAPGRARRAFIDGRGAHCSDLHQSIRRHGRVPGREGRGSRAPVFGELRMAEHIGLTEPPPIGASALPPETFRGQSVVVTGGGTGLGRAIAIEFARLGADLVILSRKPEHLDAGRAAVPSRAPGSRRLHATSASPSRSRGPSTLRRRRSGFPACW